MRGAATQIEFSESIGSAEAPIAGDPLKVPYRRLVVHGGFIVLATEITAKEERPVASGLLGEEPATMLASLVRAARWEGFPEPGEADAGSGSHWATITFEDAQIERVVLRFEPQTGVDGVRLREGVGGFTSTVLAALGTLLDAAFERGTKGLQAWHPPPLDGPRDTVPSPEPTTDPTQT